MFPARIWRERAQRYRNESARCKACGHRHFPPRAVCEQCGGRDLERVAMALTGRVLTWTVVHATPPDLAADAPYVVAVLEMDDGTRTLAQVADVLPEQMRMEMPVRLEFRRIRENRPSGVIAYGHKAVAT